MPADPRRRSATRSVVSALAVALLASCGPGDAERSAAPSPNLLLVVLDDLGMNDLGANGNAETSTPRLDRLAAEGVRFTRHYAFASCAPARAALLTGRHPARLGFLPRGRGISRQTATLADRLRAHGYDTHHVGKWHLGGEGAWGLLPSPMSALPGGQGFDHWFGFADPYLLRGPRGQRLTFQRPTYRNPWLVGSEALGRHVEGHLTRILTDHALGVIRGAGEAPWLLHLSYLAPHRPIDPSPRFRSRHPDTQEGRYRALVEQLDHHVGRLLDALDETGQADRTLVVVVSDNGSPAAASNAPYPGTKTEHLEGGLRTPLLVRWPGVTTPGRVVGAPVSILDLVPTLLGAAGTAPPEALDGRDLAPLLVGDGTAAWPPRPLFWQMGLGDMRPSFFGVLSADGRWRLAGSSRRPDRLFDLTADPATSRNVAAAHPDVVAELRALHRAWRQDAARVRLGWRETGPRGQGLLVGDDLQRSPGWAGWVFGLGVTAPGRDDAVPGALLDTESVVSQHGVWSATSGLGRGIRIAIGPHTLESPPLPMDRCAAVVVSSSSVITPLSPVPGKTRLALYVDGARVDALALPRLLGAGGDLAVPTRVGLPADGHRAFSGRLGRPVVENLPIRSEGDADRLAALGDELCPPAAADPSGRADATDGR